MPSKAREIVALILVVLSASTASAGPIGDMFARHRMNKEMPAKAPKAGPSPFHGRGVGGGMTPSTFQRFQNRFASRSRVRQAGATGATQTTFSASRDSAVSRTSR